MKKFAIACAVLMAGIFTSCGDTNYCYEVTETVNILGTSITVTEYLWCTSNELDASIEQLKKEVVEEYGLSEDAVQVSYRKTNKSEADCVAIEVE